MATTTAPGTVSGYAHVTKVLGVCGGKACIDDSRIRVLDVVVPHREGWSVERIIEDYPSLTPAQVHSALAYHFDHPEEVEDELAREREAEARYEQERAAYIASHSR